MSKWIWRLADNGWADWICPECGWKYNDDIHVTLDYKYCPNCGKYLGETPKEQPSSSSNFYEDKHHGKLIDVDKFIRDFSRFKDESWTTLQVITFLQNEPPVAPATGVVKNCISRQQAIDDISNIQVTTKKEQNILNICITLLKGMSSITPVAKSNE